MRFTPILVGGLILAVLGGCAQTSAVMVEGNKTYPPVTNTQVLSPTVS